MPRFYRTLVGPAIIGMSVWCAAGTVAVLSNTDTGRVVALAPWWVGLVATAIAACVPAWRERLSTTLPALMSTLPWWPVPLPAMALLWTGPMAWVPIGAAVLTAVGSGPLARLGRVIGAHEPARATRLAAVASLLIGIGAAWAVDPRVPGGDEPHYLVITQSLLKDGDLQIENNHAARDYASFFGGTIKPDFLARGRGGVIYSIHAPGVSAIVLPAFALFGFRGAQATVIFLFAITGALMWRATWRLTGDTAAAWFAWAAVAGSTTMAVMSFMVFPDAPGACAVAAGVWLLVTHREAGSRGLIAVSAALAALPWLHTRFSVLAGALGLALLAMLFTDSTKSMAMRWRRAALFIVIPAISAAAWLSMFYVLYGTVDPRAPYGPDPEIRSWIWGAVTGLFVDQQFGVMTYAPVLFVAFIGCVMAAPRQWRLLSALCVGMVLIYAMAVASYWMWWAGVPGLPARFLTAALPLLAMPIAVAWVRSTAAGQRALLALLMLSLAITALILAVDRGAMAWNARNGQAAWLEWLSPVVNLPRAWPSFFWNGEAAFLGHAALMIALAVTCGAAIRVAVRRYSSDAATARLVVSFSMLAAAMLLVEAGWTVTASAPLDPARAQLAVHTEAGSGASVWQVGRGLHPWDAASARLQIRSDQAPLADQPSAVVFAFANVPGGLYQLDVRPGNLSGSLTVRIGRSPSPLQRFSLAASSSQTLWLTLPVGAAVLVAEADSPDFARQLQVTLMPASFAQSRRGFARQHVSYSDTAAFFLDANVFPEAGGFWVRGSRTTDVVLSQGPTGANRARTLTVRNGAAANTVTIRSGAWQEVLALGAGEERTLSLPLADALGAWPLTITSSSGFRPSDTGGGDNRFLGAWIEMRRP